MIDDDGFVPDLVEEESDLKKLTVPTVFSWQYGGKEVYISGSFNDWKTRIALAHR